MSTKSDPFENATKTEGTEKIERYTNSLKRELRGVKTEEDVRITTVNFLKKLAREVGVNITIKNEMVVLTGGKIDSLFDNIIFEFKKPAYFDHSSGIEEAIKGRKGTGGLIEYLVSRACDESSDTEDFQRSLSTKIGVGFDGKSFIFVRYVFNVNTEIDLQIYSKRFKTQLLWFPESIDGFFERTKKSDIKSGLRFLSLYMRSISPRSPLTPENVSRRFGEDSAHFKKHLDLVYSLLHSKLKEEDPHTKTLYGEWDRVFGQVYGDLNTTTSDVKQKIIEQCRENGFSTEIVDLKLLIFSIHTYYNIILKLLVSNLFSSLLHPFTQRTILTRSDERFKKEIIDTVQGEKFKLLDVKNFFETGFFEWWIYVYNNDLSEMLREVIALLEELEVTTSITKPELIGDMIKHTYHELMHQGLRHLLGEYFTPDWLAEFTIESAGFSGKLGETFLDPACGSGTFLVLAIRKKILKNSKIEREKLVKDILQSIVGFDLNPISVIASKANYLLALGDLSEFDFPIKIPVYQCDSILTPAVHAVQKQKSDLFEINTICGKFKVPALGSREAIEAVLDDITLSIKNNFTELEFLEKIRLNHEKINEEVVLGLFKRIKKLTEINKNGLWIPILKNSFAPVYSENQFDYIVGNPPWVSWRSMSRSYREQTLPIWLSYDIFNKSAYDKITTHDDFAMAFTYVSADHYLKNKGKLCFVISQAFFKSKKGGEGFRKFRITRENSNIPLKVEKVVDMVKVKPFSEVANRTSVLLIEKGNTTQYPVPYFVWTPKEKVTEHDSLLEVKRKISEFRLEAIPIKGVEDEEARRKPWLTLPAQKLQEIRKIIGQSAYRGRKGVEPLGAKGVYILKEPNYVGRKKVQICNDLTRGRLKEVEELGENIGLVEDSFIYPQISGRDVAKYGLKSCSYILMPHESKEGVHNAIPENELKIRYTATYEWLSFFEEVLLETRKRNSKFFDEKRDPFYFLDNIGTYTFSPWKVVWREQSQKMTSCVISTKSDNPFEGKLIIPDSKVLFCPLETKEEAHYLCAVLNSKTVTELIEAYTLELQKGIDVLENVKIPKFNPKKSLHNSLSSLSQKAHEAFARGENLIELETEIQEKATNLF